MKNNKKYVFEIRQIDAFMYDDGWNWNTSYFIGNMYTNSENINRAFVRYLNKQNIYFKKSRTIIDCQDGGFVYEIQDRKTKEPLFAAIYHEQ